jgi:signal transduction histidine kinase
VEPTDLELLVAETVASFTAQAAAAAVELVAQAPDDLPLVDVDPVRIREVLSNLISNALRYTPAGGSIRVTVSRDAADSNESLAVAVQDTGKGVPPEALPHIFDSFFKSEESRGTGLGLAVARKIVEAHGGQIAATSSVGEGTTIRFTLPTPAPTRTT